VDGRHAVTSSGSTDAPDPSDQELKIGPVRSLDSPSRYSCYSSSFVSRVHYLFNFFHFVSIGLFPCVRCVKFYARSWSFLRCLRCVRCVRLETSLNSLVTVAVQRSSLKLHVKFYLEKNMSAHHCFALLTVLCLNIQAKMNLGEQTSSKQNE